MRVGINMLSERWPACGMRRYLLNLLRSLQSQAEEHRYIRLYPDPRVYRRGLSAKKTLGKLAWELWGVQKRALDRGVDVLHCPYWASPLWPRVPTVVTVPDVVPILDRPGFEIYRRRLASRMYYWLVAAAARRASAVIALSQSAAKDISRLVGVSAERIYVTPLAVEPRFRRQTPHDVSEVVLRYGLSRPYVVFVGAGFDYRKDLPTAMKAFKRVRRQSDRPLQLVVVGDARVTAGTASAEPHQTARELGLRTGADVNCVGFVDEQDLPALYTGAEVLLCTSQYEGFGLSVLEAMACEVPVLVSDIPALRELCGAAGTYAAPQSEQAFSSQLADLLRCEDLRKSKAELGLERARASTWDRVARQTTDVYEQALQQF